VLGQNRSTNRYSPRPPDFELKLVRRMNELASQHPRWGYRMVWRLLQEEGWKVNKKRVERLWRLEGHKVPPQRLKASGKKAQGSDLNAIWNLSAGKPNQIWSYDFMGGHLRDGTPIRILNVVDEFTREALVSRVDRTIGALAVMEELTRLFAERGRPEMLRSDNGREFIATTLVEWLSRLGVTAVFVEKGSPQQDAFIERFNGTMRNELLNGELFETLLEARVVVSAWREGYNHQRPHRGLGMLTPSTFAKAWNESKV
jgi:putative transposase